MCVKERESERECVRACVLACASVSVCVCVQEHVKLQGGVGIVKKYLDCHLHSAEMGKIKPLFKMF